MEQSNPSAAKPEPTDDSYRLLIETVQGSAIFILDPQGHVVTWNIGAERIKGFKAEDIIGKHFSTFYPPEDIAAGKPDRELVIAAAEGRIEDEGWRLRKDGTRLWAHVIITALRDANGVLKGFGKVTRDLTQRRQAEEELRRSEERFRLLVEGVGDYAIYMLDPTGHVETWNTGAEKIKGFTAQEVVGKHFSVFFTPEANASGDPDRELAIAAEDGRFEEEGIRLRKDGSRFWANVVLTAIRNSRGDLMGYAKVTRDLTTRRAAEEIARELIAQQVARTMAERAEVQLREEGERYRALSRKLEAILEGVGDGISVQDRDGRLLFANSAAARTSGYVNVAEFIAATPAEIMSRFEVFDEQGDPIDASRLPGRRVLQTGVPESMVLRVRDRTTDRTTWSFVRGSPVVGADGKPELAVNIWHDITKERRREERERYLARATATLSSSLDYPSTLSALANLLVPGIADWCAIHLVTGDELQNVAVAHADASKIEKAREFQRKYPPPRESVRGVWNVLRTGKPELYEVVSDELIAQNARSTEHMAFLREVGMRSVIIVPIAIRDFVSGTITLVSTQSGRHFDRDDVSLAEELARRAAACIESAKLYTGAQVAAKRAEEAAQRAEDASRLKDEFLATVSHELRTPLNAIVGWSALLRERTVDTSMRKGIDVIHRNALAQAKIIDDILDVSRIITGNLRLELQPGDLSATIRTAIEVVMPSAAAKHITLELEMPAEPCSLIADHDRMQQVAWNLLSNAVKFTDEGGQIVASIRQDGSTFEVSVKDTGIGIDRDFLPYAFDRFKQADSTTTRRVGGLGLGLAIVRHIVELHGGRVRVQSEGKNTGSTFTFTLPIRAVARVPLRADAPLPDVEGQIASLPSGVLAGARVLVVDNELDARELLQAVLMRAGAEVDIAASAAEGFDKIQRMRPHVLVSDIGMPDEDGYSFMRRVRALDDATVGNTPAIALTAYTRSADTAKALAVGFTTHIAKPVNPNELLDLVAKLVHPASKLA